MLQYTTVKILCFYLASTICIFGFIITKKKKIKKERINNKKEKQTIHFELESNLSIEYTYVSLRKCSL